MSGSAGLHTPTASRIGEQLTEWKSDMDRFFRDDWSRLRSLMMDLEEAAWGHPEPLGTESAGCVQQPDAAALPNSGGVSTISDQVPSADRRLSDLAEKIARRLRSTGNQGS